MTKKLYEISITGESSGSCTRELTDYEFELIKGIFEETESEYCGGEIYEVPGDEEIEKIGKDICLLEKPIGDINHYKLQLQVIEIYGYSPKVSGYVAYKLMDIYYKNNNGNN